MLSREKAWNFFKSGYNCAQSVFAGYSEDYGMSHEQAFKVAAAYGGGIGGTGNTCGAITGACMVLGLKYGDPTNTNSEVKMLLKNKTQEFIKQFNEQYQLINCRDLLAKGKAENFSCFTLIDTACDILETLLEG